MDEGLTAGRMGRWPRVLALAGALAVTGCAPRTPLPAAPPGAHPPAYDPATVAALSAVGWTVCAIDREQSRLAIRVAPTGSLARLGHHHIISSSEIGGYVAARGRSRQADLFVAGTDLVVDDPSLRAAAGGPYADAIPDGDRADTRRNLLGPKVLAAAEHGWLRVTVDAYDAGRTGPSPDAVIRVAGNSVARQLTVARFDHGRISGSTALTHRELGLEPFTALGGALAVADPIELRYDLVLDAVRDPACGKLGAAPLTR